MIVWGDFMNELDKVYRGDVIKCYGYKDAKFHISVDKSGRERSRYGKFDTITMKDTVLIKVRDNKYLILSEVDIASNLESCVVQTFPTNEESLYVDESSLRPYIYFEESKKK